VAVKQVAVKQQMITRGSKKRRKSRRLELLQR
jgi:hypothetical protein